MSAHKHGVWLARLLACVLALLALVAQGARAEVSRLAPNGQFASEGGGLGVAVDQSTNDVFVAGFVGINPNGNQFGRIQKFDASDRLLSPPSPFGEQFNHGAAVNPTNGDLYVVSATANAIDTYDPNTGELISSFSVPQLSNGEYIEFFANTTQIAADSAGDVYVPNIPGNEVLKYSPTGTPLATFMGSGNDALKGPNGVAIDASGDVWVADSGNSRIVELSPAGTPVELDGKPVEIKSEGVRSIALYEHQGAVDVLAVVNNSADPCGALKPPCGHLVEYSSSGVQLADVGAGELGSSWLTVPLAVSLVAVDDASGRVYLTDALKSRVLVFQPPVAPTLGQEFSAEVGTSQAKLGAVIDPGGAKTSYRFEYDTRAYTAGEGPHGVSVPLPEGTAGEGFSRRTVWASTSKLAPGTTYHYRVLVTNAVGTVVGADRTFTTETAAQASCPNEQTRGGFSVALPDCRAYELVTPASKASTEPDAGKLYVQYYLGGGIQNNDAASNGNRFSFVSLEIEPGAQSAGEEFIAARGASGWVTEDALPLQPYNGDRCTIKDDSTVEQWSPDLSKSVIMVNQIDLRRLGLNTTDCRGEAQEVVPGEPLDEQNLLLRNNESGAYQLINLTPRGVAPTEADFVAASADLTRIVFTESAKLTPEALNNDTPNMYEWSEGVVRLVSFTSPSGAPVAGSFVRISPDGSEIFFTAGGKLYMRLEGGKRTVQLDGAQGGAGPGGGGALAAVTADGSQIFFTDDATAGLTSNTVPGSGANLYSYDVSTGQLSDLTPVSEASAGLLGISEDGSYMYFSSNGVLSGSQANQLGETARSGVGNLYVDHHGTITFIMREGGGEVSPNGAFLAFESTASLTGYDNVDQSGAKDPEIYLYSAAAHRFECASCNPSGEVPTAGINASTYDPGRGGVSLSNDPQLNVVSNNGQVFFQTSEVLLPRDTDGSIHVYEYAYNRGLGLISPGEARLLGISSSGDDVFFLTSQELLPRDSFQEGNQIYDARVDGGFVETVAPECATADACRAAPEPQPAIYGAPSSQTFSGAGNLASTSAATPKLKPKSKSVKCRKGFLKKKGKCVKKSRKKAKVFAHTRGTGR